LKSSSPDQDLRFLCSQATGPQGYNSPKIEGGELLDGVNKSYYFGTMMTTISIFIVIVQKKQIRSKILSSFPQYCSHMA
jgi:hypothetical protein